MYDDFPFSFFFSFVHLYGCLYINYKIKGAIKANKTNIIKGKSHYDII